MLSPRLSGTHNLLSGFRTAEDASRQWGWASFILGIFEFIIGGLLIVEPLQQGTGIYLGASIRAVIGGALRLRSRARGCKQEG